MNLGLALQSPCSGQHCWRAETQRSRNGSASVVAAKGDKEQRKLASTLSVFPPVILRKLGHFLIPGSSRLYSVNGLQLPSFHELAGADF